MNNPHKEKKHFKILQIILNFLQIYQFDDLFTFIKNYQYGIGTADTGPVTI